MANIFLTYLGISATVGIVVLLILLASPFINRRYAAKWKYYIWIFLAIRLLIPVSGMYYKKSENSVVNETVQSSGTVVYERTEIQKVQPRRFVVEIPVKASGQIARTPDVNSDKPKLSLFDIAFAAWIAGAIIFVSVPVISLLHYKYRITRDGERIESGSAFDRLQQLKSQLKIKRNVSLIRFSEAASPMIIGFLRPALVLPCDEYSDEELQFIIRHELIHLRRGDVYIKLLCVLANALHWFNPLIWIMRREAVIDMELSCDEGVIKGADFGVKKAYTETLMSSLRRQSSKKSSLSTQFYGGKGTMKKRFTNILGKGAKKNGIVVLICAVLLAIFLGVIVGCTQKASIPSGDELTALIDRYLEFEAICTYDNFPADFDNPASDDPDGEEHWIYPVTKEGMTTWEDWQSYLGGIFTESGVEKALEKTAARYINHNGNLYYSDGGMGWTLSGEYSVTWTTSDGDNAFTVEFRRQYDPDFTAGEPEFCITTLAFEYTSAGWRISDYSDRNSAADDNSPDNEAATPLSDDEMNRLIAEYLRFERYCVYGCMSFTSSDPDDAVRIGDAVVQEIELDGSYYPSDEEGLTTWQEWLDFLNGLFTPEATEEKLNELTGEGKRYMNVGGDLYVLPGGDMGWPYGAPIQATYDTSGNEGVIEFWREDFLEEDVKTYLITVFRLKPTESGWRIAASESHSYPGNDGFAPMMADPTDSRTDLLSDDEMNSISEETVLELLKDEYELNRYLFCGYMKCGGGTAGTPEYPEKKFYKCGEEDKDEWSEWEAYVRSIYCGEAAKTALGSHSIVNIDGMTYTDWDSEPREPSYSDSFTIALISRDADRAVYTVTASAFDNAAVTKDCEYIFENTPDGWRISGVSDSWSFDYVPSFDDEMNSILNKYLLFDSYTESGSVKIDWQNTDRMVTKDGIDYCPSIEEGLTTWQEWSDFFHDIFVDDLAETNLKYYSEKTRRYIDVDGRLYVKGIAMGVHYSEPVQAGSRMTGRGAQIEYWQEALFEGELGKYLITLLTVEATDAGWKISGSERHMYPRDKAYVPMLDEPPPVSEFNEGKMNRLIYDYRRFESYFISDSVATAGDEIPKVGSYRKSVEEGLTTWNDFLLYLYGLFTDEAAEKVLADFTGEGNHYINVDGYLYAWDGGMGWYYGEPVQAAYKTNGSEGVIEFWREDGSEGREWCYYVTALKIWLTGSGWRVYSAENYNVDLFDDGISSWDYYTISQEESTESYELMLDKPYSIDKSSYAANKIYRQLMYDYQDVVDILTFNACEDVEVINGVDQIGNLREIEGVTYIPLLEYYDTPEEIRQELSQAFTRQKCDKLYKQFFEENDIIKEIDGRLYCEDVAVLYSPFKTPFESAVQISDTEIVAKTVIEYDPETVPYEVTFKYEDGAWKIDKLAEDGIEVNY